MVKRRLRDVLWSEVEDVYSAILAHPFIREMLSGALKLDVFKEYVIQDYLYLSEFSRAVALVAVKAPRDEWAVELMRNAVGALSIERGWLHEYVMSEWGIEVEELGSRFMSPVNHAYTSFLLSAAYSRTFLESLAAIMPCFWIYREVGLKMAERGSPNKTYQRWIDTYTSKEYGEAVENALKIMDEAGESADQSTYKSARSLFRLSTIYEYMFWDHIYRGERWPFSVRPEERRGIGP